MLIEAGASLNVRMEDGNTPLHHAVEIGDFDIARLLVESEAPQNVRNDEGEYPRDLCWDGEWANLFGDASA